MFRRNGMAPAEDDRADVFAPVADLMVAVVFIFMLLALGLALRSDRVGMVPRADYDRTVTALADARAVLAQTQRTAERQAESAARIAQTVRELRDKGLVPLIDRLARADQARSEVLDLVGTRLRALGVNVGIDGEAGTISLPASTLFASGRSDPSQEGTDTIVKLARVLGEILPCYAPGTPDPASCPPRGSTTTLTAVYVEGHTDVTPFGSLQGRFRNNWDLSAARAIEAFSLIRASSDRVAGLRNSAGQPLLGVSGYADTRPASSDGTDRTSLAAMERDRRIEIRFLMGTDAAASGSALSSLRERLDGVAKTLAY